MKSLAIGLLVSFIAVGPAAAHFHMLIPDRNTLKTGEKIKVSYRFGHPFEAELSDAEKPAKAWLISPDGTSIDVLEKFLPVNLGSGEQRIRGFECELSFEKRGDYTLVVQSPDMRDENEFVREISSTVIHVQSQRGWDRPSADGSMFVFQPMTRPYGLRPGVLFQARLPQGVHAVELERFNEKAPAKLPPAEHITLSFRTDERGVASCSLMEPGWWGISAEKRLGPKDKPLTKAREGKEFPVRERATFWVLVDKPARD